MTLLISFLIPMLGTLSRPTLGLNFGFEVSASADIYLHPRPSLGLKILLLDRKELKSLSLRLRFISRLLVPFSFRFSLSVLRPLALVD